jgi:hypothetical protein
VDAGLWQRLRADARRPRWQCSPKVGGGSDRDEIANVQVVLSGGQALRIDNHFPVMLGSRRTYQSDVHAFPSPGRLIPAGAIGLDSFAPAFHLSAMSLGPRTLAAGFIAPCLPTKAETLPSSSLSLHEI